MKVELFLKRYIKNIIEIKLNTRSAAKIDIVNRGIIDAKIYDKYFPSIIFLTISFYI
tara:strand:+ start:38 stop:208 length:171 start_codon:yes stop_codon:yes gene_type:complete